MKYSLLKQLLIQVTHDIQEFIPNEYFCPLSLLKEIPFKKSFNMAIALGLGPDTYTDRIFASRASEIGRLILRRNELVNARQYAACMLLVPLGKYVINESTKINNIGKLEIELEPSLKQFTNRLSVEYQIPGLISNFRDLLIRYLDHLSEQEKKLFKDLLADEPEQIKKQIDISILATKPTYIKKNKSRRNILDPAIDEAINKAGNTMLPDVYLQLKEMALNGKPPFTGVFNNDAIYYTNDNNELAELSKEALRQRLRRR